MANPPIYVMKPRIWPLTYYYNNGSQATVNTDIWWLRKQVSETLKNSTLMARRRRGESVFLPPLPYFTNTRITELKYSFQRLENDPPNVPNGYYAIGFADPGSIPDGVTVDDLNTLTDQAFKRAYDNLKQQNINFAQFFAEGKETAELIASTAGRLARGLRAIKKGNIVGALKAVGFGSNNRQRRKAAQAVKREAKALAGRLGSEFMGRNAKQATKKAASEWLSMQFGWMPLLSDLDGAAKLMAERSTQDPKRTRFCVTALRKLDIRSRSTNFYANPCMYTWKYEGGAAVFVRMDFYFSDAQLASLSADGLTNPLSIAWEVTPFTFLYDYVADVGGWISRLDSSLGKTFIGGSVSRVQKWTSTHEAMYYKDKRLSGNMARFETVRGLERTVLYGFPDPTMFPVDIRNPLKSTKRIANSLAVLRQVIDSF